jgi:cell division protein FtsB
MAGTGKRLFGTRRASSPERSARVRRIVHLFLVCVAVVLFVDALVGDRGLLAMRRARRDYEALQSTIARQRAENERLREEARRLREDPGAIEEIARRELGLIRPGEKLFIIRDLNAPPTP